MELEEALDDQTEELDEEAGRKDKLEKIEREREKLLKDLAEGRLETQRNKVAYLLCHYPNTRNNDQDLYIQYIKFFHADKINEEGMISLESLKDIQKQYDLQRMRALIQNTYKQFMAVPKVRSHRRVLAEEFREKMALEGKYESEIAIFADESGKTDSHIILGSYWMYDSTERDFLESRLGGWRAGRNSTKEFHSNKISQHEIAKQATSFFGEAFVQTHLSAFNAIIIDKKGIAASRLSAAIYDGFAELVINGIKAEFESQRISPPIRVSFYKDEDKDTDLLELSKMKLQILGGLQTVFRPTDVMLRDVKALNSTEYDLIQVADLFTFAVNRWVNQGEPDKGGNAKHLLAYELGRLFGFYFEDGRLKAIGDHCKLIYLSDVVDVSRYR
jgi:hypothetical protein